MRKRQDRSFDRYYEGNDGLRHIIGKHFHRAACGQSTTDAVKMWGGPKLVTCLMCLGDINR